MNLLFPKLKLLKISEVYHLNKFYQYCNIKYNIKLHSLV
jgi:hypothetical protein